MIYDVDKCIWNINEMIYPLCNTIDFYDTLKFEFLSLMLQIWTSTLSIAFNTVTMTIYGGGWLKSLSLNAHMHEEGTFLNI